MDPTPPTPPSTPQASQAEEEQEEEEQPAPVDPGNLRLEDIPKGTIQYIRSSEYATPLYKLYNDDTAGLVLSSAMALKLKGEHESPIPTDILMTMPKGYYGILEPLPGHRKIAPCRKVLEHGFTGPLYVPTRNLTDTEIDICVGDPLARLYLYKVEQVAIKEVQVVPKLDARSEGMPKFQGIFYIQK